MSNITLFVVIIYTAVLLALTASSGCKLKKNAVRKKIKQYQNKCLKKGFQSSIDCKTERGKLSKKVMKKCRKLEGALKKCDYSCLPPIDGGWTDYREWTETACSVQCGGGRQIRRRSCSNPAPTFGGADCVGKAEESQSCNTKKCPDWGSWTLCPYRGFATSFKQKVQSNQGGGDDTALNGICLICSSRYGLHEVCSTVGPSGSWSTSGTCSSGFNTFDLRYADSQGSGDDTGANALRLYCSSNGYVYSTSNEGPWGQWMGLNNCQSGKVICGIRTRVEKPQGSNDDTALIGVELYCC